MKNNVIITVGTSQLEPDKIKKMALYDASLFGKIRINKADLNIIRQKGIEIIERLNGNFNLESPDPDLLGAEISTMALMEKEEDLKWRENGTLVLLASDTQMGKFARNILYDILTQIYEIPESRIKPDAKDLDTSLVIHNLTDNPPDQLHVNHALENLATVMKNQLVGRSVEENNSPRNIAVISGGFKSIIPCMTTLSLIYGFPLVYRFENSNQLQSVQPRSRNQNGGDEHKFWIKTLRGIREGGWGEPSPYLNVALEDRLSPERQNQIF